MLERMMMSVFDMVLYGLWVLIVDGVLCFGDCLFSEGELCEWLGVLCGLLCEVICMFVVFGVLEMWYGLGSYVSELWVVDLIGSLLFMVGLFLMVGVLELIEFWWVFEFYVVVFVVVCIDEGIVEMFDWVFDEIEGIIDFEV